MEVGLGLGEFVFDGDPAPPPLKVTAPNFRLMSVVAQRLDGVRCHLTGVEVGLGPGDTVIWGPIPMKKVGGTAPFSTHVYCGQTAGWIKMPLGMEVGLDLGDFVLVGDPAPPQEKREHSLLWPNGWADQDVTWYEGRPRSRSHCVR